MNMLAIIRKAFPIDDNRMRPMPRGIPIGKAKNPYKQQGIPQDYPEPSSKIFLQKNKKIVAFPSFIW
jgi:hypothetical protein